MSKERPSPNGAIAKDWDYLINNEIADETVTRETHNVEDSEDELVPDGGTGAFDGPNNTDTISPETPDSLKEPTKYATRPNYGWQDLESDLIVAYGDEDIGAPIEGRFHAADVVEVLEGMTRTKQQAHPRFPVEQTAEAYESVEWMLHQINVLSDTLDGKYLESETGEDLEHPYSSFKRQNDEMTAFYEINENSI